MTKQRHIIGRTVLELDTGRIADVWSLQEDVSRLFQQQGVPEIERLFDELVRDGEVIRLDRVEVEIGSVDRRFLADEFIGNLLRSLRQTLGDRLADRVVASAKTEKITRDAFGKPLWSDRFTSDWEVLLYFLRYGRLPWWCPSGDWQAWFPRWEAVMQSDTAWQQSLRELLRSNQAARQRLIEQLPESFLHQLILQLQPAWTVWTVLLAQARQLMQSGELDSSAIRYLDRQTWLLLLSEIGADNAPIRPFPATWTGKWLAQLVEIWQQQRLDLNQIRQRLRAILEAVPSDEQTLWLTALDRVTVRSLNQPQQAAEFSPNLQSSPKTDWEVLLYFLEYGRLPSEQASADWLHRWETVIQNETAWQIPLRELLRNNVAARQRLIAQLPEVLRHQLVLQLQPAWTSWQILLAQAKQLMQSLSLSSDSFEELSTQAWELLLTEISADNTSVTPLPAATWTRNWLAQLMQNWRWSAGYEEQGSREQGAGEAIDDNLNQIAQERLRTSIDAVSRAQRSLWLNAYKQVLESKARSPQNTQDSPQTDWQVLLYFLSSGYLPKQQASENLQTWLNRWETVIQTETAWQQPLRELLRKNVATPQRLIAQLPEALRHQIVLQLQPAWTNWHSLLAQARELMQSLSLSNDICEQLNQQAWRLLLAEIGSDTASARPLPAATWTRNWLTQLVQNWQVAPNFNQLTKTSPPVEAAEPTQNRANQNPRQHLRNAIAALSITDTTLWLNALEQVLTAASANTNTPPDETKTSTVPTIPTESPGVPAPQNEIDAAPPPETNTLSDATTTPTDEPTPAPQQNLSVEQVELRTPEPSNPQSIPPRRARGSTLSAEEETAGLYINQAGLVLLHPFLRIYLDEVGLLDGESFRDESAQQTAIYLLHYLATKQTDAPEYELVLPKLLCGWPLDEPVSRGLDLPATALTEGENLLQTVINYWEVLKSTSPDGLRDGFLQRAGKLTRSDDGNWKLQVEQQAIDILLSRLPWGLSMVKLPWMDDILIVEWH
ncbi:MAG: contractile injection system tape measure protein [Aulosira sp. ZfuVER01]|nr:contractile injection system tape measure protein [Aulosira sp. ZfuVER01]MDZ8000831.1 contractile injection system tape measure protein [Aulosira sp. DedVER01a]MDZ8055898.1 contractile injection system tape measure protein [Aulosira sp. ZfuCHP01]